MKIIIDYPIKAD